jgi:hypothetical protein
MRKRPNNPWLVSNSIAQDVNRDYGHERTDVEEAVLRLSDIGKLSHKSETHTSKGYSIGSTKLPGIKSTTIRYRISDKGMQDINPSKHAPRTLELHTDIHAGNVVVINGHNVGTINQSNVSEIASIDDLVSQLLSSDKLQEEAKKQVAIDAQLLKTELLADKPRKTIVEMAWSTIEKAAAVVGIATAATPIAEHLIKFL